MQDKNTLSDKNTIILLNCLYSGSHGNIKCVLQLAFYYFLFKRQNEKEIVTIIEENIVQKIENILSLLKLALSLGGELKILDYKVNAYGYYFEEKNKEYDCKKIIAELVISEEMLIKEYDKVLTICTKESVIEQVKCMKQKSKNNIVKIRQLKNIAILK